MMTTTTIPIQPTAQHLPVPVVSFGRFSAFFLLHLCRIVRSCGVNFLCVKGFFQLKGRRGRGYLRSLERGLICRIDRRKVRCDEPWTIRIPFTPNPKNLLTHPSRPPLTIAARMSRLLHYQRLRALDLSTYHPPPRRISPSINVQKDGTRWHHTASGPAARQPGRTRIVRLMSHFKKSPQRARCSIV